MESKNAAPIFGYLIDRTAKSIKADLKRRFKDVGADITPEQWLILDRLKDTEGIAQVELGNKTYKDAPTVSRIIDLLCKKGYAERLPDAEDRRRFKIYITYAGRQILLDTHSAILSAREIGWQGLTTEDFVKLKQILSKIYANTSP
ncbi:MAG: MarR family transcriptional regulator [Bacteroidota bacterium]